MALVLNENSYTTTASADLYFETRIGSDAWTNASVNERNAALVTASLEIDDRAYIGYIADENQDLAWPRKSATYFDKRTGLQKTFAEDEVPDVVLKAVYEQALHVITNNDAVSSAGSAGKFESISVGSISLSDNTSTNAAKMPKVSNSPAGKLIAPLVRRPSGGGIWRAN